MNALILYYSRSGNTEQIAKRLHSDLGFNMLKIEPEDQGCGICDFHVEECTRRSCDNGCFSE